MSKLNESGNWTIDPEELLDIRKHALECAARLGTGGAYPTSEIINIAKQFEKHLTRKVE